MTYCAWCGNALDDEGADEITCERGHHGLLEFDTDACLDQHIRAAHPDRPIDDRPDLLPLGRKR